jgi:uroporphyrin-III C-methyltransferase/precorrin-2 dehydrogenase/sirohydrochlorin ferrochelatase
MTGHDHSGQLPDDIDWNAIADPKATTVVYMPGKTLATLSDAVLRHGLPPDIPALAVFNATRPDERVIEATIATLPDELTKAAIKGPVIVIFGNAVGHPQEVVLTGDQSQTATEISGLEGVPVRPRVRKGNS